MYMHHLTASTHVIQAVGFHPNVIPTLKLRENELVASYDGNTAGFRDEHGKKIPGLYAAGIAYPERVVNREGNVEYAIGLWKFMTYLQRVVPGWSVC